MKNGIQFGFIAKLMKMSLVLILVAGFSANAAEVPILTEDFNEQWSANRDIDPSGPSNESPESLTGTGGSGFLWGGYCAYTDGSSNRALGMNSNAPGLMQFLNNSAPGTYFYTIFDTGNGNNADTTVDLSSAVAEVSVTFYSFKVTYTYRYLLREAATGDWYASEPVSMPAPTNGTDVTAAHMVSTLEWFPLDAGDNTNLNLLAGGDEQAITIGTTAGSPDFSAVDGGGYYQETGTQNYESPVLKINDLTWNSNTPLLSVSASPQHELDPQNTLVLGPADTFPPSSAFTGNFTLQNDGAATLTLTDLQLNNTGSYIDYNGGAPSTPLDIVPGGILNIGMAFNPTVELDEPSSASLVITSNNGGVAGTTNTLYVKGNVYLTGSVFEPFNIDGNRDIAKEDGGNEEPQPTMPPPAGTGYRWGGRTNATGTNYQARVVLQGSGVGGRLLFYSITAGQDDATNSANYNGSYAYTIFDSLAGTTPDRQVDLDKIELSADFIAPNQEIRYLVRDGSDQWFLTQDTFPIDVVDQKITVDVDDFSGWLRVDATAEAEMNQLDTDAQVAIADPGTLSPGTPNLTAVTGGGVYIEVGDTSTADRDTFAIQYINWIQRASENDRLTLTASDETAENVAVVPYRGLDVLSLDAQVTSGTDVVLNGLTVEVTPNDGSLLDAGIFLQGGGQLTSSSISGGTATLAFLDDPYSFVSGPAVTLNLLLTFDDTVATGTAYTVSLASANFDVNEAVGGTDDAVILEPADPATANLTFVELDMPDKTALLDRPVFLETWDDVTGPFAPNTYDFSVDGSGPVVGSDLAWTYSEYNENTHSVDIGAGFTSDTVNVLAGVETKDLSVDPFTASYGAFSFTHEMDNRLMTTGPNAQIIEVGFTAQVTQTNFADESPSFTATRTYQGRTYARLRLRSPDDQYFDFTLVPDQDDTARAFSVSSYTSGQQNGGEVAPAPLKGYDDGDGVGTYDIKIGFAAYDAYHTRVHVSLTNVDTTDSIEMTTLMDGDLPLYVDSVELLFGKYANVYLDDISMTVFGSPEPTAVEDGWMLY